MDVFLHQKCLFSIDLFEWNKYLRFIMERNCIRWNFEGNSIKIFVQFFDLRLNWSWRTTFKNTFKHLEINFLPLKAKFKIQIQIAIYVYKPSQFMR